MQIFDFEEKDSGELIKFYREYLNDGDEPVALIRDACEKGLYFGSKAVEDGKTIGFFTFQEGISFTCPRPELYEEIRKLTGDEKTATVDTLVVLPEYRGRAITADLLENNRIHFRERGIRYVMTECWVFPDGKSPSLKYYKKMGKIIYEKMFPDFYSDISKYSITCPICGKNCSCGADILLTDLSGN
ncbi:MAG: GNAT family N-acetyltransferase [Lachnospiraceae bacterium]|nr:GNAT family N-acetyltransferase [Lachnospiraceae bacterium]